MARRGFYFSLATTKKIEKLWAKRVVADGVFTAKKKIFERQNFACLDGKKGGVDVCRREVGPAKNVIDLTCQLPTMYNIK